ncbi:MAG: aryl-sulfate sulfotransferase [Chitinophagales bacterium]
MKKLFPLLLLLSEFAYAQQTVGLFINSDSSYNGYTLFAPIGSTTTYLIDNCGRQIHTWASNRKPGNSVYIMNDGSIVRPGMAATNAVFGGGGGGGGVIEKIDWNGNLLWSYLFSDSAKMQHHDIRPLENGNVLVLAWERFDSLTAIAAGRKPTEIHDGYVWCEFVVELQPSGTNTGNVVWEWHLWNHLVQDYDSTKSNYGNVEDHAELLDINFAGDNINQSDWIHANSIDYNAARDEILLSSRWLSEIYIIDHSTSTLEAATHSGGNRGRGGDILYRWGNDEAYRHGTSANRKLYTQHSARWIEPDKPDAGKIIVFNNGVGRPGGNFSSVEIVEPQTDANNNYRKNSNGNFLPDTFFWHYQAATPATFFDNRISGAEQMPNGNILICSGTHGKMFELDKDKNKVWEYVSPITNSGVLAQGSTPGSFANTIFRVHRLTSEDAALSGRDLTPGLPLELNPLPQTCELFNSIVEQATGNFNWAISPNPVFVSGELKVMGLNLNNQANIRLTDMNGRLWMSQQLIQNGISLNTSLPTGVYLLQLSDGKAVYTKRIVIIQE